jgi:FkbM family methyltransferase
MNSHAMRDINRRFCMRLFRNRRGQALLGRIVSQLDLWRGYGAGVYVASSGEQILFQLAREKVVGPDGLVIFDVGANVGDFSAAALDALGRPAEIHAFEPQREVFQKLAARFGGSDRVIVNHRALGRAPGEMPLYGNSRDAGMASLLNRNLAHVGLASSFQEMVKVERLDNYCEARGVKWIHLLKMDVEGFELEVLAGAEKLFAEDRVRLCSFEFGGCNLDSRTFLRDFFEFFSKYRMKINRITPTGTLVELGRYSENLERFTTTNYVALRDNGH